MANFNKTVITNKGKALIAKANAGLATIQFTKINTSDYEYPTSTDFETLISLQQVKQTSAVSGVEVGNTSSVKVRSSVDNSALTTGYYLRAIGLYANDPQEGEILYSITTANIADWVSPITGINASSIVVDLITRISNTSNVSISVNQNAIATIADVNTAREELTLTKADKNYVDTHLAQIGNASPKGTYATLTALQAAYPTGTTGIFVVVADGKWYYWNGSAWTVGGTYQSTGIASNGVKSYMIDANYSGINLFNKADPAIVAGYYLDASGNPVASTNYSISHFIPVIPGQTVTVSVCTGFQACVFDANHNFIAAITGTTPLTQPWTFTLPSTSTIRYMKVNINHSVVPLSNYMLVNGATYPSQYYAYDLQQALSWLLVEETNLKNSIIKNSHFKEKITPQSLYGSELGSVNIFNKDSAAIVSGYFVEPLTGELVAGETYVISEYISVSPSEVLTASKVRWKIAAFYDDDLNYVAGLEVTSDQPIPCTFTVPVNPTIAYMRLNVRITETPLNAFMIVRGSTFPAEYVPYNDSYALNWLRLNSEINLLDGSISQEKLAPEVVDQLGKDVSTIRFKDKVLFVTGDSITEGTGTTTKTWHSYLGDWLEFSEVKNDGKSGTGLIAPFGSNVGIYTRMDTWNATYDTFDVMLLMGNMNDGKLASYPLGNFTDAPYPAVTSQYAVLHAIIQKIIAAYPTKPIGWIVSTPRKLNASYPAPCNGKAWGKDSWFEPYANAVLEVCGHYSIPCLDLYHNSGLRPWNDTNNSTFFSGADGVHPNAEGHKIMAEKILEFVKQFV